MVDNAAEKNDNKNIRELRLLEKTKYVPSLYTAKNENSLLSIN